jgi:hypothetical protein
MNTPASGDYIANAAAVDFAKWLAEKKLAVNRIIGVHGPPSTPDVLQKAAAAATTAKN